VNDRFWRELTQTPVTQLAAFAGLPPYGTISETTASGQALPRPLRDTLLTLVGRA
jgi:hypothetical protein